MKKTTVYLNDEELKLLKKKAFLSNKSVAELIRLGVRLVCNPSSKEEQKIFKALEEIRDKFQNFSEKQIQNLVYTAKQSIRSAKKSSR